MATRDAKADDLLDISPEEIQSTSDLDGKSKDAQELSRSEIEDFDRKEVEGHLNKLRVPFNTKTNTQDLKRLLWRVITREHPDRATGGEPVKTMRSPLVQRLLKAKSASNPEQVSTPQGKEDDSNNPEKGTENDSELPVGSPSPKWSKTFQGASVTDPVSVMAMMMEEMRQERIQQERERREDRAAERERQERLEKLLIETAAKAGSQSRGNSPTPSLSGSSVGNDAQLITRRFNRM